MRTEIRATAGLALPMILGHGTQVAMHVVDTAMVGRLGVNELAASAMGNNAAALFFFAGVAVGTTVPVLAARAFGARDRPRMNLVLRHGLTVSWLYALGCAGIFAVASPFILPLFGPAELVQLARPYAILLVCSLLPALLVQNLRGFAEAQNRPWLPIGNILLGVGLNVLFNYALIYGHFGLPALGLPGAALGTLLARWCMLAHFVWLLRRWRDIAPAAGAWRPAAWRGGFYGEYLRLALPSAAMVVVWGANGVVVAALMGRIGPVALAASEIVRQLYALLFAMSAAFQAAIAIRVAQTAGAGDHPALRRVAWSSAAVILGVMGLAGAAVFLGRGELPRWFVGAKCGDSLAVASLAAQFLAVAAWGMAADALSLACVGVFRGLARVRAAAAVYLVGVWVIGLPLAYGLGFVLNAGGVGIWWGLVSGNWITAAILTALLARTLARLPPGDGRGPRDPGAVRG